MLAGRIVPAVSDTTNCQKFYEDCLKGIVITDDRDCRRILSDKRYSENPGALIRVYSLSEVLDPTEKKTECAFSRVSRKETI